MRVYELAQKFGVTSADVLKKAGEKGLEATSAISVLDDGDAKALEAEFSSAAPDGAAASRREAKKRRAEELRKAGAAAERERLAKNLAAAKAAY